MLACNSCIIVWDDKPTEANEIILIKSEPVFLEVKMIE